MRYVKLLIPVFILTLLISACSSPEGNDIQEEDTLRSAVQGLDDKITWTEPIEAEILGTQLAKPETLDKNVEATPFTYNLVNIRVKKTPLYPELEDFASLDLSLYEEDSKEAVNGFCRFLCEYSAAAMKTENEKSAGEASENKDPVLNAAENSGEETENNQNASSENKAENVSEVAEGNQDKNWNASNIQELFAEDSFYTLVIFLFDQQDKIFISWRLGQPFVNDSLFICPVRLNEKTGLYTDIQLYLENTEGKWKISQIQYL